MDRRPRFRYRGVVILSAAFALLTGACAREASRERADPEPPRGLTMEVHRSASCDCCGRYEAYLRENGVRVISVVDEKVADLKTSLGVPDDMRSCHTSLIEGYYVEGHVPLETIRQLVERRPAIDGIALPGMPPGSPGMEGVAMAPLKIYAIDADSVSEFAEVRV